MSQGLHPMLQVAIALAALAILVWPTEMGDGGTLEVMESESSNDDVRNFGQGVGNDSSIETSARA
ncbi:hypothetical protein HDF13_002514 [Edaphobacter lichenicola]|uniref:Uncharacterized protein n=1 Tax=Tunturiibacter gelidiferens TaxID=3069689 RepID=A0ACC5P0E0_9BACT|nr:hypothetical protein [Edaphobacter lichenicola]